MNRSFGLLIAALLLTTAGALGLLAGWFERRMGVAQEDMAVLDFADPQADYVALQQDLEKLPWVPRATRDEIRVRQASLQYWQGNYADLAEVARTPARESEPVEPQLLLLAANASYRAAQLGPQDKATLLKTLDEVILAYGEALKADSERQDAAFNYELVVKIREEIANGKRKALPRNAADEEDKAGMHGDPGEPPADMKTEQFLIRVPSDPNDARDNPDETSGAGRARRRKG